MADEEKKFTNLRKFNAFMAILHFIRGYLVEFLQDYNFFEPMWVTGEVFTYTTRYPHDQMQRRNAYIGYKSLLRKINKEGVISRKAFFRAIDSKHDNYIPAYFQGMLIPSITHRHGYFISKKFLKEHADKYGFYTTKSGI